MELDMKASTKESGRPTLGRFRCRSLMQLLMLSYFCCSSVQSSRQAVPLNKWKELGAVKGNKQFILGYVENKKPTDANLTTKELNLFWNDTAPGFNPAGLNIIAGEVAEPAGCVPQERAVAIPPNSDPTVIHWPPCTKIAQCGGCCGTDILECTAIRTESTSLEVMKVKYSGGSGNFEFVGLNQVTLTKHLECDCRCRIQAHHCDPQKQDYNEQSCSCRCRNENEATSCPSLKIWNDKECACVCPRILNCLDDEFFSFNSCSCQRGSLEQFNTPVDVAAPAATSDPCAGVPCRSGYRAVSTSTGCVCRLQTRSAGLRSRSAIGNRHWSRGSSDFDMSLD